MNTILVISGWWARGFYALWVLKFLEEIWMDKKIDTIFGVSIWAIIWAFWSAGYSAQTIRDIFLKNPFISLGHFNLLPKKSILTSDFLKTCFQKHLPVTFDKLTRDLYVWTSNICTWALELFQTWRLHQALLASSAIPWVFPPVKIHKDIFIDWWVINNFPVDVIKQLYPKAKIIWIALNKFKGKHKIDSFIDVFAVSFEIFLRKTIVENIKKVDYMFYPDLWFTLFETNKSTLKRAFALWYADAKAMFI